MLPISAHNAPGSHVSVGARNPIDGGFGHADANAAGTGKSLQRGPTEVGDEVAEMVHVNDVCVDARVADLWT